MATPDPGRFEAVAGDALVMIHADDLGLTVGANEAFVRLFRAGRVDGGSVMVPCPHFPDMAERAAAEAALDVGVHLTLTAEKADYRWPPLTRPPASAGLTDEDGFLPRTVRALVARAHPEAVEAELRAQVDAALAAGVDVTHLDDHMAAVLAPPFIDIYARLGQDYRVPVLMPRSLAAFGPIHNLEGVAADEVAHEARVAAMEAAGMLVADRVLETPWVADAAVAERWSRHFDAVGPGFTLLLIHADLPGAIEAIEPDTARLRLDDYDHFAGGTAGTRLAQLPARRIAPRELRDRLRAGSAGA